MRLKFADRGKRTGQGDVVRVIDGFYEPPQVREAYAHAQTFRMISSGLFWFEAAEVALSGANPQDDALGLEPYFGSGTEFVGGHLRRVLGMLPADARLAAVAVELWFTHYHQPNPSEIVYLHTDSNHTMPGWAEATRVPMWGTILYLGPEAHLLGGETSFCTEQPIPDAMAASLHESIPREDARRLSREWVDVPHKANRLVIFDGALAHFVAPVKALPPGEPRIAMLVNFWDHWPVDRSRLAGSCMLTPEEFRVVTRFTSDELEGVGRVATAASPAEIEMIARLCRAEVI